MKFIWRNMPIILVAVGGLFAVVGTFWSSYNQKLLQSKLQEATTKNLYMVTGGDSFPILSPDYNDATDVISFVLFNMGKYPLYDVGVEIQDTNDNKIPPNLVYSEYTVVGVYNSSRSPIYKITLPKDTNEKIISVNTNARNGKTVQTYKIFRSSGQIGVRTEVYREGKLIYSE